MRSRLYSILLVPLLVALSEAPPAKPQPGAPGTPTDRMVIELTAPAPRAAPSPGSVPGSVPASAPASAPAPAVAPSPSPPAIEGNFGVLEGTVTDARTGAPVDGAEVGIPEADLRTVSDKDGKFRLEGVPARSDGYEVLVTRPGYQSLFADQAFRARERVFTQYKLKPAGW